MSKAFTSEETIVEPPPVRPPPRLGEGEVRYITREGYERLRSELADLDPGTAPAQVLAQTLATLTPVDPLPPDGTVRFGSTVTLSSDDGERRVRIVGPDEAHGREQISVAAPLARALLGKQVGDEVSVQLPRGHVEYSIESID
jgi:transcription elongation GreA/GreB family factor